MNVSGVGATPPPPPLPPVAPAPSTASPTSPDARPRGGARGQASGRPQPPPSELQGAVTEAPPLRMITVTEMRVMLGQLPVSAALRTEQHHGKAPHPF